MSDTSLCTPISRHYSRHPSLRLNTSDALSFIPPSLDVEANSDTDSLFDEIMHDTLEGTFDSPPTDLCGLLPARLIPPPIPGLFFKPTALTQTCADEIMHSCLMRYFRDGHDQVMLFERLVPTREGGHLI